MTYTNGIRDASIQRLTWDLNYYPAKVRLYTELDPAGEHHKPFYSIDGTIQWR